MKKPLFLITVIFTVLSFSCEKDDSTTPPSYGLLSYYRFEKSGQDETSLSNATVVNGTYVSDPLFPEHPVLSLEGTGYADLNSGFDYRSRALSMWFKATSVSTSYTQIFSCAYENYSYGATMAGLEKVDNLDYLRLCFSDVTVYHQINQNQWYNFVMVLDGMNYSFYVDGELIAEGELLTYFNVALGYENSTVGANRYFDRMMSGSIADTRLYKRALTAEEVYDIYHEYKVNKNLPE
jgi:hypothetical protein